MTEDEKEKNEFISEPIKVVEERLKVEKEKVVTDRVKISKKVLEEEIPLELTGTEEEIEIERKKIGQVVDEPGPAVRAEGDSTVFSLYKEIYVKQIILEEEVRVTKKTSSKSFHGEEKLKREILDVERIKSGDGK